MKGLAGVVASLLLLPTLHAQIRTDGSMGARQSLAGPNVTIPQSLGRRAGGNLFHSFESLDVARNTTASFTGDPAVARVIARVTGGAASRIDGALRNDIAGADLYLLNPSGMLVGPDGRIETGGSLYVGAASGLRFRDGTVLSANAAAPVLTAARPEAFGFLSRSGTVSVRGTGFSSQGMYAGGRVHLSGSRITLTGTNLSAAGAGNDVSLDANDVELRETAITAVNTGRKSGDPRGPTGIAVTADTQLSMINSRLETQDFGVEAPAGISILGGDVNVAGRGPEDDVLRTGPLLFEKGQEGLDAGGRIKVAARNFTLENGRIFAGSNAAISTKPRIEMAVDGDILLNNATVGVSFNINEPDSFARVSKHDREAVSIRGRAVEMDGATVFGEAYRHQPNEAGPAIGITADRMLLRRSTVRGPERLDFRSETIDAYFGNDGIMLRSSGPLELIDSGIQLNESFDAPVQIEAGLGLLVDRTSVIVHASGGHLRMRGGDILLKNSSVSTRDSGLSSHGPGAPVPVYITATGTLDLRNSTVIEGLGGLVDQDDQLGGIFLGARRVSLTRSTLGGSVPPDDGSALIGLVRIHAVQAIEMHQSTILELSNFASAGDITLRAPCITLDASMLSASVTLGQGRPGPIRLTGSRITLRSSKVRSESTRFGGGRITISGDVVTLLDGTVVSALTERTFDDSFDPAEISINATDRLSIIDSRADGPPSQSDLLNPATSTRTRVSVEAVNRTAGKIMLNAGRQVYLLRSLITARSGLAGDGEISIDPLLVVINDSVIDGLTGSTGVRITIDPSAVLLRSSQADFLSDNTFAPAALDISGSIVRLPEYTLDGAARLTDVCTGRLGLVGEASSFILPGRQGSPVEPGGLSPAMDWPALKP